MKTLQSVSSSPLYFQLKEKIKAEIERGKYPVGSKIPPEHEIEESYQVSRVTVRRALQELTEEGLLERKQGKGTFVSVPRIHQDLRDIHSFHEVCRKNGTVPGTKVIRIREIPADEKDMKELNLPKGAKILEIIRVRSSDNLNVMLEINHFSMAYSYLEDMDLNGSLYRILQEYGIVPAKATHEISLHNIDSNQALLLETETGRTVLKLREVIYDQKGRPLHNSLQLIRGDRFTFMI